MALPFGGIQIAFDDGLAPRSFHSGCDVVIAGREMSPTMERWRKPRFSARARTTFASS